MVAEEEKDGAFRVVVSTKIEHSTGERIKEICFGNGSIPIFLKKIDDLPILITQEAIRNYSL
jgi:hypothetical protein